VRLDELLRFALDALEQLNIPYMVVGSFVSGVYGEARLTQDIDIVTAPTVEQLSALCDAFGPEDFFVSREAAVQALTSRGQFNVLDPTSGTKLDFMIAKTDPWAVEQLARRERTGLLPDRSGFVARPEDIIISKMQYYEEGGSEKHLRDIVSMLKTSRDRMDRAYLDRWINTLKLTATWQAILSRLQK
jgi:hypothetical protein